MLYTYWVVKNKKKRVIHWVYFTLAFFITYTKYFNGGFFVLYMSNIIHNYLYILRAMSARKKSVSLGIHESSRLRS